MSFNFKTLEFLDKNGTKIEIWQPFSKKANFTANHCLQKVIQAGIKVSGLQYKILEIIRTDCRVFRDEDLSTFNGYEYKVLLKVKSPFGDITT